MQQVKIRFALPSLDLAIMTLTESNKKLLKYTALWSSAAAFAYWVYWNYYGRPSSQKRKDLERELAQAQRAVRDLEEKLMSLEQRSLCDEERKEIRLWVDGAFDMMHYGHMNAFRQARALGTYLIAGVNSSETIAVCKGTPVCSDKERVDTVRGCRWVDEVVAGVPYVIDDALLLDIVEKYKIDYVVHGDDPCIVNGKNVYEAAIKMGKYLTIPRTEGVSTTDIVGRMLLMTTAHHDAGADSESTDTSPVNKLVRHIQHDDMRKSNFLTTSRIIRLFGAGLKAPKVDDKVVYIAGSWDMFHAGHIEALEKAKTLGTYVIVGVHNDQIVNNMRGMNLPIMSLHERTLSVLGCKWVDDVLIDAPYAITQEMISSLRISIVVQCFPEAIRAEVACKEINPAEDPYALPKQLGIMHTVFTEYNLSALDIVERIQNQKERYSERFAKKMQQENDFYRTKYSL